MKRITLTLVIAFLSCSALAQSAPVVELSAQDAAKAITLYSKLQQAQKEWDSFLEGIGQHYLVVPSDDPEAGTQIISGYAGTIKFGGSASVIVHCDEYTKLCESVPEPRDKARDDRTMTIRRGFNGAFKESFELSSGFKYIVPKEPPRYGSGSTCWNNLGGVMVTPASSALDDSHSYYPGRSASWDDDRPDLHTIKRVK